MCNAQTLIVKRVATSIILHKHPQLTVVWVPDCVERVHCPAEIAHAEEAAKQWEMNQQIKEYRPQIYALF